MSFLRLYRTLRCFVFGLFCLTVAVFLFTVVLEIEMEKHLDKSLRLIPNYNYNPDIRALKAEGKLEEALEMARYVIRNPDLPGQEEAKQFEKGIERELFSLWNRARRAAKGFVFGSGASIEELTGSIASDLIIWGDIRDLAKQGYYKATGQETDPVIAALAGIGLLTGAVSAVDWAPAVLKAFRKVGALSRKFADFIISACKKSVKTRKLDGSLKSVFMNLKTLSERMGLARSAAVFKHVDTPADLAAISKVVQKNVDAAYFTLKNGGSDGVRIVKRLGDTDVAVTAMTKAAKKGPDGIRWLSKGGAGHKYVIRTRFGARVIKNLRLNRPQQLIAELAKKSHGVRKAIWATALLSTLFGVIAFTRCGRNVFRARTARASSRNKRVIMRHPRH